MKQTICRAGVLFLVLLLIMSLFSGCFQKGSLNTIEYIIGVSQANMREPWRLVLSRELKEEAAKHPNIRLVFTDAGSSVEKQKSDIDRLSGYGMDLLIISPCDARQLTGVVSNVYKDIPVIVLDRAVDGYDYSLFIGPDNQNIGRQAAKSVVRLLDGKQGNVLEVCGSSEARSSSQRSEGFADYLHDFKNIRIFDQIIVSDDSRDTAEDLLLGYGDRLQLVDVIFAHNDYMALGAHRAIQKLGYDQRIRIVGIDGFTGENGGLQMVRQGVIDETITCGTGGREAIQYAVDILNEQSGVPKQIILRSHTINQTNIDEYETGLNKPITPPERIIRLGYAQVGTESAWRLANHESIRVAADDFNILLFAEDANQSQEKQIETVRGFIKDKMDVILLSPVVQTGWDDVLQEAKDAGIPVLLSDRKIEIEKDDMFVTFIGSDFLEEGRRAVRWITENVKPENEEAVRILEIQGSVGATPTLERKQGFEQELALHKDYRIIHSRVGDYTYEGGREVVSDYIRYNGWDIDVIYCHNDDMALGAIAELEANGIVPGKDVEIVSVDGTKEALKAIIDGKLSLSVECSPLLGPQVMKAVTDLMSGKELPLRIITDEKVFDKEDALKIIKSRRY